MLIINADDWGRSIEETNLTNNLIKKKRLSSISAMVFMSDSKRASQIANESGIDVGLHINFSERFSGKVSDDLLNSYHQNIRNYLAFSKYSLLLYNPFIQKQFRYVFNSQIKEFIRLYNKPPCHINGHHHFHLATNILLSKIIPEDTLVRRNFTFRPNEKNIINRTYRKIVDSWLSRRYLTTDYFFALSTLIKKNLVDTVVDLSKNSFVELETHPIETIEYNYLLSVEFSKIEKVIKITTTRF